MYKILIIDDDAPSLDLLTKLLRAAGHNAIGVTNGKEALRLGLYDAPDLVLCDVMIPEMGGCEILRQFRSDASLRWSPVVAVTALATVGDRERLLAAGFDGYFSKPIVPMTFAQEVEKFLTGGRAALAPTAALTGEG